jgi:hypothetical protein
MRKSPLVPEPVCSQAVDSGAISMGGGSARAQRARLPGEARLEEQGVGVAEVEDACVVLERIAEVQRRVGEAGAHDAEARGEAHRVVVAEDRGVPAGHEACGAERVGHAVAQRQHLAVAEAARAHEHARPVGIDERTTLEKIAHRHGVALRAY